MKARAIAIEGLTPTDRAFELDGARVVVRIRRLDGEGQTTLIFTPVEVDASGEPVRSAPLCPPRSHTLLEAALAAGAVNVGAIIEAEVTAALERFETYRAAAAELAAFPEEEA